jgi:predicted transposase/invertase (TIGR01784 family)
LAGGHKSIRSRAIYNACDLHANQKGVSIPYDGLVRTYQITFCGYTVFGGREDCFNRFSFRNKEGEELLDAVNIIFVELSKLKNVTRKPVMAMTAAEMWAIFLAHANKPKHRALVKEIIAAREEIRMAYEVLTSISRDEDERARFRARRKFQMDMAHDKIVSHREGKLEGKLEDAKNMLAIGLSADQIVQVTGLAPEQIKGLRIGG